MKNPQKEIKFGRWLAMKMVPRRIKFTVYSFTCLQMKRYWSVKVVASVLRQRLLQICMIKSTTIHGKPTLHPPPCNKTTHLSHKKTKLNPPPTPCNKKSHHHHANKTSTVTNVNFHFRRIVGFWCWGTSQTHTPPPFLATITTVTCVAYILNQHISSTLTPTSTTATDTSAFIVDWCFLSGNRLKAT